MLRELLGLSSRKSFVERLADRIVDAVEQAAGSVERTRERATGYAGEARRRTGARWREAGERARAGRDAVSERVAVLQQRAAELKENREARQRARAQRSRVRHRQRPRPMQLNVSRDDRIVLRGRQPIDVRMTDGGVIRYRYHERPSFWLRALLHATGRQVWPRR